jgi:hypothetical protein
MGRSKFSRVCPNPFTCGVKKEDATSRTASSTLATCCISMLFVVGMLIVMGTTVWASEYKSRSRLNHLLETCMLEQGGVYQKTPAWATESLVPQDEDSVGSAIRGYFEHSPVASFKLDGETVKTVFNEKDGHLTFFWDRPQGAPLSDVRLCYDDGAATPGALACTETLSDLTGGVPLWAGSSYAHGTEGPGRDCISLLDPNGVFTQCKLPSAKGVTADKLAMVEQYMQYKPYCFFLMARNTANGTFATPMNPMLYRNFNGDSPKSGTVAEPVSNAEAWALHCSGDEATTIGQAAPKETTPPPTIVIVNTTNTTNTTM